jgi:hypothetical protein
MPDLHGPSTGNTQAGAVPDRRPATHVGGRFIALYALAYIGTILLFLAPLLVSLLH